MTVVSSKTCTAPKKSGRKKFVDAVIIVAAVVVVTSVLFIVIAQFDEWCTADSCEIHYSTFLLPINFFDIVFCVVSTVPIYAWNISWRDSAFPEQFLANNCRWCLSPLSSCLFVRIIELHTVYLRYNKHGDCILLPIRIWVVFGGYYNKNNKHPIQNRSSYWILERKIVADKTSKDKEKIECVK